MFSGFNLKLNESELKKIIRETTESDFNDCVEIGKTHLQADVNKFKNELRDLINRETIDGNEIEDYCFPNIEADVFLSHSHKDRKLANALAGWLNSVFGLNVFVDSNVWEYAEELLEKINSTYSNKRPNEEGYLYDHKSCCKASEHVNIMLASALLKMIDKTECVILLNTDNSIPVFEKDCFAHTYSPWIYSEIVSTQLVRKKPLLCYRKYNVLSHFDESVEPIYAAKSLTVSYGVSLNHLMSINSDDLAALWLKKCHDKNSAPYPLDYLYEIKGKYKNCVEKTKELCNLIEPVQLEKIRKYFDGESDETISIPINII